MSNKVKVPGGAFYAGDGLTVDPMTRTVSGDVTTPDWNQNDATASDYIKNRPFYEDSLLRVSFTAQQYGITFDWYKVSDDVPSIDNVQVNTAVHLWVTNPRDGIQQSIETTISLSFENGYAVKGSAVIVALTDGFHFDIGDGSTIVFPKKGTYFLAIGGTWTTGIAASGAIEPEISWDMNTGTVKKLDEKFIPDMDSVILNSSTTDSTKKFRITVDDSGKISATEVT